jgi:Rrf2 family transcriptional regulator, nitric oxide-sensitive transcriptional repressor
MQLTAFTDYALRGLISVGTKDDNELSTIGEIATQYGISRNHLIKVVHQLGQLGYLSTIRGKGGGFRLAKRPSEIRIGDVVRATEQRFDLVPCLNPDARGYCAIEPACMLKRAMREAAQAFLAVIDDYTLADLLRPRQKLRTLLSVNL